MLQRLALFVCCLALGGTVTAQVGLNEELVKNGDFEDLDIYKAGTWEAAQGTVTPIAYSGGAFPGPRVQQEIGGGRFLARALFSTHSGSNNYYATLRQRVDLRHMAADIDAGLVSIRMAANLGGSGTDDDWAGWYAHFRDDNTNGISSTSNACSNVERNYETTMPHQTWEALVPTFTREIWLDLSFWSFANESEEGYADNVSAVLVTSGQIPDAVPYGVQLLEDPGFADRQMIHAAPRPNSGGNRQGWYSSSGSFEVQEYGLPGWPTQDIGNAINGGRYFVRANRSTHTGSNNYYAYFRDDFDVRGNAADIDAGGVWLRLAGDFGGLTSDNGQMLLAGYFYDEGWQQIGSFNTGWVNYQERNRETTLLPRSNERELPKDTRYVRVELQGYDFADSNSEGVADNLSAMLQLGPTPPPQVPLDTELLDNGDFEASMITNPRAEHTRGWRGMENLVFEAVPYGMPTTASPSFANSINGGQFCMRATGSFHQGSNNYRARIYQSIDVRAHAQEIDAGRMGVKLSGFFGGYSTHNDNQYLYVVQYREDGTQIQSNSIGNVRNSTRNNVTRLHYREGEFILKPGCRSLRFELHFWHYGSNSMWATADNLSAKLVRPSPCGAQQCFRINSSAPAWVFPIDDPDQFTQLNAGPPAFSSSTWQLPFRRNANGDPRLNHRFSCTDPTVIPLNEAYVDANEYLEDADEVTRNNCGSAFYRFTFNLPGGFDNVSLAGVANADDMAVVFLNGNRISAEISAADLGADRLDSEGHPVITHPTRDAFFTNDKSLFKSGTNELVFGVASDVSPWEPAGLEFEARVTVDSLIELTTDRAALSAVTGGTANLTIDGGPGSGAQPYFVIGSFSGMWPGFDLDGYTVPLNQDFFFGFTLSNPNHPIILGSAGQLATSSGQAFMRFSPPPLPFLVGQQVSFAAIVGDLAADFDISNPVRISLVQ